MGDKEVLGVSVATILRYLALIVVLVGLGFTGTFAVTVAGWQAIGANVFRGLLLTLFFSSVLYGISYLLQVGSDTATIFGIKISTLLRYLAIVVFIVGILYAVFSGMAAAVAAATGWVVNSNILYGLLLTISMAAILYGASYIFAEEAKAGVSNTSASPKTGAKAKGKTKAAVTPEQEPNSIKES